MAGAVGRGVREADAIEEAVPGATLPLERGDHEAGAAEGEGENVPSGEGESGGDPVALSEGKCGAVNVPVAAPELHCDAVALGEAGEDAVSLNDAPKVAHAVSLGWPVALPIPVGRDVEVPVPHSLCVLVARGGEL